MGKQKSISSKSIGLTETTDVIKDATPTTVIQKNKPSEENARQLVSTFEEYQSDYKAEDVMSLFTPPENPQDADIYIELMGLDLAGPRLYSTNNLGVHLQSFEILSFESENNSLLVKVKEKRRTWDNMNNKWVEREPQIMVFKVVQLGLGLRTLVDKYYPEDIGETKYSGFYY